VVGVDGATVGTICEPGASQRFAGEGGKTRAGVEPRAGQKLTGVQGRGAAESTRTPTPNAERGVRNAELTMNAEFGTRK